MKHNNRSETTETETLAVTQTYSSSIRPLSAPVSSLATPCAKPSTDGWLPLSDAYGIGLADSWENCAGAVRELCDGSQRTLPLEWENCAPAAAILCC